MTKPLVFIIDDDAELTKLIERRFLIYGCDVKSFTDANLLLKAIDEMRPKLILVDINLGDGLSGFDIIKAIRNDIKADVPIIIMSGDHDQKNIAHSLEIGANDYIAKPPLKLEFEETIAQYITTERLPEPTIGTFQSINSDKESSMLTFCMSIEEVHSGGLTLLSDHLIKKGASFYLCGEQLRHLAPTCSRIFVNVISSSAKTIANQKKYQIQVEIDSTQELALKEVRNFLDSKFAEQRKDTMADE